jgi:hypothetical protein
MSGNYAHAVEEVKQFFRRVSAETDAMNGKINESRRLY